MNLITWKKEGKRYRGYTECDLINGDVANYEIEHNTHLKVNSSHHNTIYLASLEDAKLCAELMERGRVSE